MGDLSYEAEELRRKLLREGSLILDVKVIPRSRSGKVEEVMANGKLKVLPELKSLRLVLEVGVEPTRSVKNAGF